MRVLHILDHSIPLHSGYTFRTRAILEQQRNLGWETFHITSPKHNATDLLEEEVDGLHFFRSPPSKKWWAQRSGLNQLDVIRSLEERLETVIKQIQPDILHAHSPVLNALPALKMRRKYGIPVVYEVRAFWEDAAVDHGTSREWGLRYRATRALETYVLKRANAVTTICEGLRNDMIERGIAASKITVIPNAVDIGKFSLGQPPDSGLREKLGLNDAKVLGFIGSFYAYEGLPLLLDALPEMLRKADNIRVLLVGGGPQEALLKEKVQNEHIADKVIFTGRVPHQEVQRYYDLIDVLVYPRLSMRLTELVTPLKPLEAMAQGRLFIASDVGGHQELIKDGETGVMFRTGDSNDLAGKALDLLARPESWPLFKQAARHFVENNRTWKISVDRYKQVYGKVLGKAI